MPAPLPPIRAAGDGTPSADVNMLSAAVLASQSLSGRNVIRNGDFSVWQRGLGPFTAAGMCADGWRIALSGGTYDLQALQSGLGLDGTVNGSRYTVLSGITGQSIAGDYVSIRAAIEGIRTLANKQVTLSFLAQSTTAGTKIGIEAEQNFGAGGSAAVSTPVAAITLTTSFVKYSVTFTVPSIVGKSLGTETHNLSIILWLSAGSTYATRSSNIGIQNAQVRITEVQLEESPQATPFERLPHQQQLAWCQRYFQRVGESTQTAIVSGGAQSTTEARFIIPFMNTMRAIPTVTFPSPDAFYVRRANNAADATTAFALSYQSVRNSWVVATTGTSFLTVGQSCSLESANLFGVIDISAEL